MDIRKGNDVNAYFELSKLGVPSAESIKGIRCFFAKDVRSESGDVPVPPSCNPSSYVIHDHMHPGYNVHMPYRSITLHVHREFCVPDNCHPGWHGQTVFVVTDYKIVNIEKEGETVPYLRVTFGGDKQRNGRYNIVLEIVYTGTDDQGHSDVKCTYDYGHQFDLTDQITALSGRIDIWLTDQKDIYTKVEELEESLAQEISRSTTEDLQIETAIQGIHESIDGLRDETLDLYDKYSDHEDEIDDLQERTAKMENVIPVEASALNKLADKEYVNQHISENAATFRGTSAKNLTESEFLDWANSLEKQNNDYVFWDTVDEDIDNIFKRYKYNGQQWEYEYTVTSNNFTTAQWAAINSGLTGADKQALDNALIAIANHITMSRTTFGQTNELSIQANEVSLHSDAPRFQHLNDTIIRPNEISVSNVSTSDDVTTTATVFVEPDAVKFYEKQELDGQPDVTKEQELTIDDVEKLHDLPTAASLNATLDSKADNSDLQAVSNKLDTIATLSPNNKLTISPGNDIEINPTNTLKGTSTKESDGKQSKFNFSTDNIWVARNTGYPDSAASKNKALVSEVSGDYIPRDFPVIENENSSNTGITISKDILSYSEGTSEIISRSTLKLYATTEASLYTGAGMLLFAKGILDLAAQNRIRFKVKDTLDEDNYSLLEFKPDGLDIAFNTYDDPDSWEAAAKPLTIHGTRSDFNLSADKLNLAIGGKDGGSIFGNLNMDEGVVITSGLGDQDNTESVIELRRSRITLGSDPYDEYTYSAAVELYSKDYDQYVNVHSGDAVLSLSEDYSNPLHVLLGIRKDGKLHGLLISKNDYITNIIQRITKSNSASGTTSGQIVTTVASVDDIKPDNLSKNIIYCDQNDYKRYVVGKTSGSANQYQWKALAWDDIASTSYNGLMSKEDKQKLDELPNNADLEVQIDNKTINWFTVNNDNGVQITVGLNDMDSSSRLSALIPNASNIKAGVMSAEDKGKLDSIPAAAVLNNFSVDSNDALHISNTANGVHIDGYEATVNSTNDISVRSVNGDITTFADGVISFEANEGAISLTSGEGAVSLTAGNDHAVILTSDTSVNIIVGNTSLQLDETKLQRLAQLLA